MSLCRNDCRDPRLVFHLQGFVGRRKRLTLYTTKTYSASVNLATKVNERVISINDQTDMYAVLVDTGPSRISRVMLDWFILRAIYRIARPYTVEDVLERPSNQVL